MNGNVFVRGDPAEYDNWHRWAAPAGAGTILLPYFREIEDYRGSGKKGSRPWRPSHCHAARGIFDALAEAYLDASVEVRFRVSTITMTAPMPVQPIWA